MTTNLHMATVLDRFMPDFRQTYPMNYEQINVCHHITHCRTEALGGLQWQCDHCSYVYPAYHSCRDRHCPQCQWRASQAWSDKRRADVLATTYYHLVFTLPHSLNGWVELHPEVIYRLLFASVWGVLKALGQDPKRLGGQLGLVAVLHTWGQNLSRHVHLHCLIPGGALDDEGQWHAVKGKNDYLFPNHALSNGFRGRMVSALRQAYKEGELKRVTRAGEVDTLLQALMQVDWVVYSKPYLTDADIIVEYLARYSHRIALSDSRLVAIQEDQVLLRYKDYRNHGQQKLLSLEGKELIRRFLLHVLPKGFMRIRHFGFLASCCKRGKLALIRTNMGQAEPKVEEKTQEPSPIPGRRKCPQCRVGILFCAGELQRPSYGWG